MAFVSTIELSSIYTNVQISNQKIDKVFAFVQFALDFQLVKSRGGKFITRDSNGNH